MKELIDITDFDVKEMTQDEAIEYIRKKVELEVQSFLATHESDDIGFVYNEILDKVLVRFFKTWEYTLDKLEYVPPKYMMRMHRLLYKEFKRSFKSIRKARKKQKKNLKAEARKKEEKGEGGEMI